jgi:hypothetical protein
VSPAPTVRAVLGDTFSDLCRRPGRHLLASLPLSCVWVGGIVALYALVRSTAPLLYTAWFWLEDELVGTVAYLFLVWVVLPFVSIVVPWLPLHVGMLDAQRRWIDRGEPLGPTSAFPRARTPMFGAFVVLFPLWMAESAVGWAGLLPAVVVEAVFGFAVTAVVVHGLSPAAAARLSVAHFLHAPLWRLGFAAVVGTLAFLSVSTVLPMLFAPALYANASIRGYRAWYGTDLLPRPL